jgi:hypothetical protein
MFFLLIAVITKLHGGGRGLSYFHFRCLATKFYKALKMCEQIRIREMSDDWNVLTGNQIKLSYIT